MAQTFVFRRSAAMWAGLSLAGLTLLGACASTPVPKEQLAVAEAAVKQASNTGTSEGAPMQQRVATDKLAAARAAAASGDMLRARQLAEQTELDARVAELHAQTLRARKAAEESQSAARALSEEIDRKTVR